MHNADGLRWVEATPRLGRGVGTKRSEVPERSGAGTRRTAAATCTIADSPNTKTLCSLSIIEDGPYIEHHCKYGHNAEVAADIGKAAAF